jgi:hypothetical protein
VELPLVLIACAQAGLLAGSLNALGWTPNTAALGLAPRVGVAAVHLGTALLLGLLFWFSWGLAAIIGISWWLRGLIFAALCWTGIVVPVLIGQVLQRRAALKNSVYAALEFLLTCLFAGLASAWSFQGR